MRSHGQCCLPNRQPRNVISAHPMGHWPKPYRRPPPSFPYVPYIHSIGQSTKEENKTLKTRNSKRMLKPYWIHLEVNQLSTSQRYDNLALVDSTSGNSSLARRLPFIDPPVCSNVPDSFGIDLLDYRRHDTEKRNKGLRCSYLKQCIIPQRRTAKGRGSSQKPRIRHFLDRLTNRQHQRGIHE